MKVLQSKVVNDAGIIRPIGDTVPSGAFLTYKVPIPYLGCELAVKSSVYKVVRLLDHSFNPSVSSMSPHILCFVERYATFTS